MRKKAAPDVVIHGACENKYIFETTGPIYAAAVERRLCESGLRTEAQIDVMNKILKILKKK